VFASGLCITAGSCDLLPSDGPNTNQVLAHSTTNLKANTAVMRFAIVGVDARVARDAEQFYQPQSVTLPSEFQRAGNFGTVGVGDLLHITVWESGDTGLFNSTGSGKKGADLIVRVEVDGTISLPYAGRFAVAGRRTADVEAIVVSHLEGQAVQPQATVIIAENVSSSVSVQGEVLKSGPYPIAKPDVRILDMIALAGGTKFPAYESAVRLTRGRSTTLLNLQDVIDRPQALNASVSAGDTILVSHQPQKFFAFGAVLRPGEQVFGKLTLNLADGLGLATGLDSSRSDAKGVYLFRREPLNLARLYGVEPLAEDRDNVPIVYQFDLKAPQSFFAMGSFPVRPNDIVYVSTAPLADAAKFFQILSGATATVAIPRTLGTNFPAGGY
jgi:polysaccharide export outer membrane protein